MLFAFDGTLQSRKDRTNIAQFIDAYDGPYRYMDGIGTRWGWLGQALGGFTGVGGKKRVNEALQVFQANLKHSDEEFVDVVGFSRGAALALQFINELDDQFAFPIRFLGLFDTVGAFGLPFNRVNLGWELTLPETVMTCAHALALDEIRPSFQLTRLKARVSAEVTFEPDAVREVWFTGAHSDIGGGNGNPRRSAISLRWMLVQAFRAGLPIRSDVVERVGRRVDLGAAIRRGRRVLPYTRARTVWVSDSVHESVASTVVLPDGITHVDDFGQVVT